MKLLKLQGKNIDEVRGNFLSIEGRASQYYWQGIKEILDEDIDFPGREHRGATDPVNSLLITVMVFSVPAYGGLYFLQVLNLIAGLFM